MRARRSFTRCSRAPRSPRRSMPCAQRWGDVYAQRSELDCWYANSFRQALASHSHQQKEFETTSTRKRKWTTLPVCGMKAAPRSFVLGCGLNNDELEAGDTCEEGDEEAGPAQALAQARC